MTDIIDWQGKVGDSWASEWARTDRSFQNLDPFLHRAALKGAADNASFLDIGCGAGATSLALADARRQGCVKGVDLSAALIATANRRKHDRSNVEFHVGDAMRWDGAPWHPDRIVSRHGVMFFADPVLAFSHLSRISADGAKLAFSCFRDREDNEWAQQVLELMDRPPPPSDTAPGPFAFADADHVLAILNKAGWTNVEAQPVDFRYVAGSGTDAVADALDYFGRIGPAARAMAEMGSDERQRFTGKLEHMLRDRLSDDRIEFDAAAWIWTAGKPQT